MNFSSKPMMIIIVSMIGILYIPAKLMILKNSLIPIKGSVAEVNKSLTRIPFYKFRLSGHSNLFYNSGTGVLSNLKNDKEILYTNINREIDFFISKTDVLRLEKGKEVRYIGLQKKNVWIDLFYYQFSQLGKIPFFIFCILMMCLNTYGIYTFKLRIFEFMIISYLVYGILILIL
ncbi:hypothetical protein [uncultured Chryseobacterium sp.]|uniref:hypothetical protein n=1 Tax=uncultured Chryseobacterium sp. TaxID=259322 RepID=UPI0025D90752|nr:hypothetical protein [uncultured Chryseobacterium sp.]